ncbi:hypothetical protein [Flammeovirga agarivorans]|uniref:Uncharacterized protein n=1 Tax=Flammeovirga agarivorans TaxID=2726742 RepID=A0A7X8SJL9_9BACT|nr:hypothetical protein [Flammeovirga agarivorans]NLR91328.1 hypothetical protein [Flammeovirga agarivorans]
MRKYIYYIFTIICLYTSSLQAQNYRSNEKLLAEKESKLNELQEHFSIDSLTLNSMIYGLNRQIKTIEQERDSVQDYLASIVPSNHVFGTIKKDISINNREEEKDYFFNQGDTVQLINHSKHTYTLLASNDQALTINTKYIKPLEGKKKTTSLIAQYQIRMEDYQKIIDENPSAEWYEFDIKRVQKERDNYQLEYDQLVKEISILKEEINLLKTEISKKTTS